MAATAEELKEIALLAEEVGDIDAAIRALEAIENMEAPVIEDESALDNIIGGAEALGSIASGVVAEPIAGIVGIGAGLLPGQEGQATRAVEATREALTFQPRTEEGQQALQSVGEVFEPIGEVVSDVESFLGDSVLDLTGSPALAAAAATVPAAALELIGLKGGGRLAKSTKQIAPTNRQVRKAVIDSAPSVDQLKDASRAIYQNLDNSGVRVTEKAYSRLFNNIENKAKKSGMDARVTPRAAGAIDVMRDTLDQSPTLSEVDTLRKVAQGVASNIDPTEKMLGNLMIDEIDNFMDSINVGAGKGKNIGAQYKAARNLWGRAKKSEMLTEAIENAKGRASGFENGLRIELDKISKNKKKSKFFNNQEIALMRDISKGNKAQNIAKLLGRFGFSEGRSTNVIQALSGVGAGGFLGGGLGAFAVPAVGTAARQISQVLTKNRTQFLEAVTRAGGSGEDIAKAYINTIPKKLRNPNNLSELLADPMVDLSGLIDSSDNLVREAVEIANGRRIIGEAAGVAAASTAVQEEE